MGRKVEELGNTDRVCSTYYMHSLIRIRLGKVWKQWENQRKICGGNHAQFAEHLLAVHNRT